MLIEDKPASFSDFNFLARVMPFVVIPIVFNPFIDDN